MANTQQKTVPYIGTITVNVTGSQPVIKGESTVKRHFTSVVQDDTTVFPLIIGTSITIDANGDSIFARHTGLHRDLGGGRFRVDNYDTITGGTGRFAGATGHDRLHVLASDSTGKGRGVFVGTITY